MKKTFKNKKNSQTIVPCPCPKHKAVLARALPFRALPSITCASRRWFCTSVAQDSSFALTPTCRARWITPRSVRLGQRKTGDVHGGNGGNGGVVRKVPPFEVRIRKVPGLLRGNYRNIPCIHGPSWICHESSSSNPLPQLICFRKLGCRLRLDWAKMPRTSIYARCFGAVNIQPN